MAFTCILSLLSNGFIPLDVKEKKSTNSSLSVLQDSNLHLCIERDASDKRLIDIHKLVMPRI